MATTATPAKAGPHRATRPAAGGRLKTDPAFQAFWLMRLGFTVVPIVFGADKFAHFMVNWDRYLAPEVQHWLSPLPTVHQTMYIVGLIEIFAGLVVLLLPRVGGYLVALWLAGIVVNLAMIGGYWDIMMRDVALCLLALSFARLARAFRGGALSERLRIG